MRSTRSFLLPLALLPQLANAQGYVTAINAARPIAYWRLNGVNETSLVGAYTTAWQNGANVSAACGGVPFAGDSSDPSAALNRVTRQWITTNLTTPLGSAGTIAGWIKLNSLPAVQGQFWLFGKSETDDDLDVQLEPDHTVCFYTGPSVQLRATPVGGFVTGRVASSNIFTIGESALWQRRHTDGFIDEMAVWDRALSDEEIAALYASALIPATQSPSGSQPPNLLLNSSFEQPGTRYMFLAAGSSALPGWAVTKGNIDVLNETYVTCADGRYCVDLQGSAAGSISQRFATVPGVSYTVSFSMAGNVDGPPAVKKLSVTAAGFADVFSVDTAGRSRSNPGWTSQTWRFVANAEATTIEFADASDGVTGYGALIDNVQLTADGLINFARNATVTASSSYYDAARAIDGDPDTNWAAPRSGTAAQPEWLLVDLGRPIPLARIVLDSHDWPQYHAGYYETYNLYTSATAAFSSAVASGSLCDASLGNCVYSRTVEINGASVRYIKFEVTGGTHWAHLFELQALGPTTTPPPTTCPTRISPQSATIDAPGGEGVITVTATNDCSWTATPSVAWLSITEGASGTGNGAVRYAVTGNRTTTERAGVIQVGAVSFALTQSGAANNCNNSISPRSAQMPASGGSGTVNVIAATNCAWSATTDATWVSVSGTGFGNGIALYTSAANTASTARTAALSIAGQTFTVNQAGATSSCTTDISPATNSVPAVGGRGTVTVTAPPGCAWTTAPPAVSWITINSGASGSGPGTVQYTVSANFNTTARQTVLTIAGKSHTVSQAAGSSNLPVITSAENYADGLAWFTPGSRISLYGLNLANDFAFYTTLPAPQQLLGVSVEVTDGERTLNAAVTWVSPDNVDAVLPFDLESPTVQVRVHTPAGLSGPFDLAIDSRLPRILTDNQVDGPGMAEAWHEDYTPVTASSPAKAGELISVMVIGLGHTVPLPEPGSGGGDGTAEAPFHAVTGGVRATIGGTVANVEGAYLSWLGEYTVELRVPDQLLPATYELQIATEGVPSQPKVVLPVTSLWTDGRQSVFTGSGGTLANGDFSLTVPPGSLADATTVNVYRAVDDDTAGRRERFLLRGLPPTVGPLQFSFASTLPAGTEVDVVVRAFADRDRGPALISTTIVDGRATVTLPRSTADSKQAARNLDLGGRQEAIEVKVERSSPFVVRGVCGEDGKERPLFVLKPSIWAQATVDLKRMNEIGDALVTACQRLSGAGAADVHLAWRPRSWPIKVYIGRLGTLWGEEGTLLWGKDDQTLNLNSDRMRNDEDIATMKAAAGHELFHLLQNLYDARGSWEMHTDDTGGTWLWFSEASATWFERRLGGENYIPTTVRPDFASKSSNSSDNFSFITFGFGIVLGLDKGFVENRGYGASMFLEQLTSGGAASDVGDIITMNGGGFSDGLLPRAAVLRKYPANIQDQWRIFCRKFLLGEVYGPPNTDRPRMPQFSVISGLTTAKINRTLNLQVTHGTGKRWRETGVPLSAQTFLFNVIGAEIPAETKYRARLLRLDETPVTAADNVSLIIARNHQESRGVTSTTLIQENVSEYLIDNIKDLRDKSDSLSFLVVNTGLDDARTRPYIFEFVPEGQVEWNSLSFKWPSFNATVTAPGPPPFTGTSIVPDELPRVTLVGSDAALKWTRQHFDGKATLKGTDLTDSGSILVSGDFNYTTTEITGYQYTEKWQTRNRFYPDHIITLTFSITIPRLVGPGPVFKVPDGEIGAAIRSIQFEMTETKAGMALSTATWKPDDASPVIAKFIEVLMMK